MNKLWQSLRGNPMFVTAYSLLGGAIGKELYTALQSGSFDWSLKSIQAMAVTAVSTTAVSLLHLYMTPQKNPGPTLVQAPPPAPAGTLKVVQGVPVSADATFPKPPEPTK